AAADSFGTKPTRFGLLLKENSKYQIKYLQEPLRSW
ncbi:unnamed protein product, partial [Allacma fusca]